MKRPRIANVQCSPVRFRPGDRVIVRVFQRLDKDATKRIRQSVQRWAGGDVEVLIVDCTLMEVSVEQSTKPL